MSELIAARRLPAAMALGADSRASDSSNSNCRCEFDNSRQSGEKKYRTEIVARDIVLLGSRDNGHEGKGELSGEQSSPEPAPAVVDDDIPF